MMKNTKILFLLVIISAISLSLIFSSKNIYATDENFLNIIIPILNENVSYKTYKCLDSSCSESNNKLLFLTKLDEKRYDTYDCSINSMFCGGELDNSIYTTIKASNGNYEIYNCSTNSSTCPGTFDAPIYTIKASNGNYEIYNCSANSLTCPGTFDAPIYIIKKEDGIYYTYNCSANSLTCPGTFDNPIYINKINQEDLDLWLDNLIKENTNTSSQNQPVTIPAFTMSDVITWMYNIGLTSKSTLIDFLPNDYLTREQASKFFVEFAKKVKGTQNNNTSNKVSFTDIGNADKTLKSYIIEANQMGIINGYKGKFTPFNKLTKSQALAMLIRITDGKVDETYNPRYYQYYSKAKNDYGIIDSTFGYDLDNENIKRGDIALLFYGMKFQIK